MKTFTCKTHFSTYYSIVCRIRKSIPEKVTVPLEMERAISMKYVNETGNPSWEAWDGD